MDHANAKSLRVEGRSLDPQPEVKPVWSQEIEDTMELAEEALSASRASSAGTPEVQGRRYIETGTPARAPLQKRGEVEPTRIERTDGSVPLPEEELKGRLQTRARQLFSTDVSASVEFGVEDRPAQIVYEFADPVTGAENFDGRLYSVAQRGRRVEFVPGTPVTRITQVINKDEFPSDAPPKQMNLEVISRADTVRWTKNENT